LSTSIPDDRYIHGTRHEGIIYTPDSSKGLEVYVDADFTGTFDRQDTQNVDTARSRHGYIITYAEIPIVYVENDKACNSNVWFVVCTFSL